MVMTGIALILMVVISWIFSFLLTTKKTNNLVKVMSVGLNLVFMGLMVFWGLSLVFPGIASAAEAVSGDSSGTGFGYLAAGLAVGLASIGAGIGVGIAGASAIGAISEKPEILGRTLIFIGLAEGVAIYGLIIAIMILGRL
ncbi:ATP synthase subunit C [Halothermothrix orenii]|uniref:ATP synthase subunit c n=1 Tax=Halothermothrix orenii (strain H 168 / OCM 544 / DSM 9562) TaxID=373903 RepID=B8CZH1_HALOH|nr:ATP synthase subunit C [Halothermothrix orenii]ACL70690.1 V-type ATP synthase subunit C [Halothermothrix orenii H 168]